MNRNFLFFLFITLLLFSFGEQSEICCEFFYLLQTFLSYSVSILFVNISIADYGSLPCSIVQGPKSSPIISVTENIQSFYCQFSDSSKENHISNYKWYLDNQELGVVNMENTEQTDHWYISYDKQLKR